MKQIILCLVFALTTVTYGRIPESLRDNLEVIAKEVERLLPVHTYGHKPKVDTVKKVKNGHYKVTTKAGTVYITEDVIIQDGYVMSIGKYNVPYYPE
jgi:hypothetical protein